MGRGFYRVIPLEKVPPTAQNRLRVCSCVPSTLNLRYYKLVFWKVLNQLCLEPSLNCAFCCFLCIFTDSLPLPIPLKYARATHEVSSIFVQDPSCLGLPRLPLQIGSTLKICLVGLPNAKDAFACLIYPPYGHPVLIWEQDTPKPYSVC